MWNDAEVNQARRRAVVAALVELAASADYRDRADAGRALASFAQAPESRDPLLRLVLDVGNTFVTLVTAEALLRRHDNAGVAIVAEALATGDFQHGSYIYEAASTVFMVFARERDQAVEICEALSRDGSARVRQGAAELGAMLAEMQPLLYPKEQG
ncbi:hypothetical protein OG474_23350 [Kribbella sp. NBC_01505]|uniref:hypothetical protein n=1 Tax=Kribbella sp. NBC_01505 TaxID=2903580 RepID=UPI00386A1EE2